MITHDLVQGTQEWLDFRSQHLNASDAPAMMGVSPYKSRAQLIKELATGFKPEVDDATQELFNKGHRYEALARPYGEKIIGDELYPVVGSLEKYSASFDGITLLHDICYEHKTLNDRIRNAKTAKDLDRDYLIQVEQQLMVSGAEKCLFHATKWKDEELTEERYFWCEPDLELRQEIQDGWAQLLKEVDAYVHVEIVEPKKAPAIMDLPLVTVQVRGELTSSNLSKVIPQFDNFLKKAKRDLKTDDDFAQAESEAKIGREAAKRCIETKEQIIAQMFSVSEVTQQLDFYAEKFNELALFQEKAVEKQKNERKQAAKDERDKKYNDHIAAINLEISPVVLVLTAADKPNFISVMKNQRTLASIYNKLDTELARAIIAADAAARVIRDNLAILNEKASEHKFLFNDLQTIAMKSNDDFATLVSFRINEHNVNEQKRLDAEREQIREQESIKAQAEAQARIDAAKQPAAPVNVVPARTSKVQKEADSTDFSLTAPTPEVDPPTEIVGLGEINYQAYYKAVDGKAFNGAPLRTWNEMSESLQAAWTYAAEQVANKIRGC